MMSTGTVRRTIAGFSLVAVVGGLVGCGSTLQSRSTMNGSFGATASAGASQSTGTQSGTGLGGPAGTSVAQPGGTASATPGTAGSASSSATGSGTSGIAPGTGTGSTPGTTPGADTPVTIPATGRGWDKMSVYIGVTTQKDVQAAAQSVGANGLDAGDQEGQANAMANELNRRGGLFGRQIKIIFHDESTVATAQDPNTAGNTACTYYTQDHPVIALLNPVTLMDVPSFRACMAKAHVPLFSASVAAVDAKVGQTLAPYFYQSVAPTWDALAPVLVSQLKAQGWFGGWSTVTGSPSKAPTKIGVLTGSNDVAVRVGALVKNALAAAGYSDTVVFQYADGSTDFSPAVLQFKGKGVTHVIVVDSSLLPFQLSANSQKYRPRYGVTSYNAPQTLLESNSPAGQLDGGLGTGWSPSLDVSDANDPGDTGPAEPECKAILAKGGQTFSGKRLAEAVAFAFCDGIRLIVQGAAAAGDLTGPGIYRGIQRIASGFSTAFSFADGLGPGRLFVPGAVRDLVFTSGCKCFRYAGSSTYRL